MDESSSPLLSKNFLFILLLLLLLVRSSPRLLSSVIFLMRVSVCQCILVSIKAKGAFKLVI